MHAYLIDTQKNVYLVFGEDCETAAKLLAAKIGGDYEQFAISGEWDVSADEFIDISSFWPYFTSTPPFWYSRK